MHHMASQMWVQGAHQDSVNDSLLSDQQSVLWSTHWSAFAHAVSGGWFVPAEGNTSATCHPSRDQTKWNGTASMVLMQVGKPAHTLLRIKSVGLDLTHHYLLWRFCSYTSKSQTSVAKTALDQIFLVTPDFSDLRTVTELRVILCVKSVHSRAHQFPDWSHGTSLPWPCTSSSSSQPPQCALISASTTSAFKCYQHVHSHALLRPDLQRGKSPPWHCVCSGTSRPPRTDPEMRSTRWRCLFWICRMVGPSENFGSCLLESICAQVRKWSESTGIQECEKLKIAVFCDVRWH